MNLSLTPGLEKLVASKVESGCSQSASEIIREGLGLLNDQDRLRELHFSEVRKKIQTGLDQLDRGEGIPGDQVLAQMKQRSAALRKNKSKRRAIKIGATAMCFLSCLAGVGAANVDARPASITELQMLFDLATIESAPERIRIVADISYSDPKISDEQISAEINYQNTFDPRMAKYSEEAQRIRTNAIARSHSGLRVLHVQEWYSGKHYRLDQTDEGMVSEQSLKDHPGIYRETYVNLDDPAFSPYRSYFADHEVRDIQLSKTMIYGRNDLWHARGLDPEVSLPLLVALLDPGSTPKGRRATDADLATFKMSSSTAEHVHSGTDKNWKIETVAEDGKSNQLIFKLRGRYPSPNQGGPFDVVAVYHLGRAGQRIVCTEGSITNDTTHESFLTEKGSFDDHGFPRLWKRTILNPGLPPQQLDVVIKEVEPNAVFDEKETFLPDFPANYIVSDITSGRGVILQNPSSAPLASQPLTQRISSKRLIIQCVIGLAILAAGIGLFRYKEMGSR